MRHGLLARRDALSDPLGSLAGARGYSVPARALVRTSDGGYAMVGYTHVSLVKDGVGAGTGFWTIKVDAVGPKKWERAFAAPPPKRSEQAFALAEGGDGGKIVAIPPAVRFGEAHELRDCTARVLSRQAHQQKPRPQ